MKNRKPMHIGIIPDGNRRWAEQHKLSREAGYAYGLKPGLLLLQQAKTYVYDMGRCQKQVYAVQAL